VHSLACLVLQFPHSASLALEKRWGLVQLEPLAAAVQQKFAMQYRLLRNCCLRGTREDVLAHLHHMAGTG
jgi:hypothetical protein